MPEGISPRILVRAGIWLTASGNLGFSTRVITADCPDMEDSYEIICGSAKKHVKKMKIVSNIY